ncbi:MAG: hypothetical protein JEZ00_20760 [Anaerolineaceae bacterium]|nr:hypothetical protein [Anaerolineaceae bacterium]
MAKKTIERKIPGGKLIRMDVEFTSKIEALKITGDFFLHPEETLESIVSACVGLSLPIDKAYLTAQLEEIMLGSEAQLIGAEVADLVSILEEAVQ